MTTMKVFVLIASLVLSCCQADRYIDLSHPLNPSTIYWPTVPKFNRTPVVRGWTDQGIWIESGAYTSGEHGGTHVDVPNHFVHGGLDLKDFPLERTIGEGVLIDCSEEASQDFNYTVPVDKILQWESEHGRIPNEAAVLIYYGYAPKFSDPTAYFNTHEPHIVDNLRFPYISAEAAKWLLDERDIKMLGSDTASPDAPQLGNYPVHVTLLSKNVMILENVNIPTSLPPRDFRLYAPPVRVENGTGIQTRIFAMVYDKTSNHGVIVHSQRLGLACIGLAVAVLQYA